MPEISLSFSQFGLAVLVCATLLPPALSDKHFLTADKLATKHVISISTAGSTGENEDDESAAGQHVRMANSTGHLFDCLIPPVMVDMTTQATDYQQDQTQLQDKTSQQVLNALSARCFYRLEDWWTYELCYEKHVRQFHREKDVLSSEYLLGVYEGEPQDTDTDQVDIDDGSSGRYVKQLYLQGDACDLTGQTRQTEVRYSCGEGGQEAILSIKEPSTCHYVLNVAVPGLCQLPTFQQETEPITQIVCKVVASPAAKESSVDSDAVTDQQQQLHTEAGEDIAELASEISTNGTEQE